MKKLFEDPILEIVPILGDDYGFSLEEDPLGDESEFEFEP